MPSAGVPCSAVADSERAHRNPNTASRVVGKSLNRLLTRTEATFDDAQFEPRFTRFPPLAVAPYVAE